MQWKEKSEEENIYNQDFTKPFLLKRRSFYIVSGFVLLCVIIFIPIIYFTFFNSGRVPVVVVPGNTSTTTDSNYLQPLPASTSTNAIEDKNGYLAAERMFFGHFYKKNKLEFIPDFKDYELPINIKTDVVNYHDVSRKLNLDPYLEDLNGYGFTVTEDEFGTTKKDFFSVYDDLYQKQIPVVVTNDFLFYYYQNILKKTFRDIEESVFYENLWEINRNLFDLALTRYRQRLGEVGFANDPVLEAERMEAYFFAVALKLLEPTKDQINVKANLADDKKFSPGDAENFTFNVPDFLREGNVIEKEVELIRNSMDSKELYQKSPVMLYYRDYGNFIVPSEYKYNAKLNNFYLAVKWLNSVFPLYYKGEACEECLLDENDFRISMAAASFVSKDLAFDQAIKNKWAVIYKFISFFRGLRRDLTYLHYNDVYTELYGEEYDIEKIFSLDNENYQNDINLIREKLTNIKFLDMEGGVRRNTEMRPDVGMRILQEYYWPNDYIFERLTSNELVKDRVKDELDVTSCDLVGTNYLYRCKGSGFDIVKLLYDKEFVSSDHYKVNANYNGYSERMEDLRSQISLFDEFTWNNNMFWVNLDIARSLFNYDDSKKPTFAKTDKWILERDYNTVLGGWVNLHLPDVSIISKIDDGEKIVFGDNTDCDHSCVEINIDFIEELLAKNEMLIEALTEFDVVKKTSIVSSQLNTLDEDLRRVRDISAKEVSGLPFSEEDCGFLKALTRRSEQKNSGNKENGLNKNENIAKQDLTGTKLLILVYIDDKDRKIMALGPVFNYQESK